MLVNFGDRTAFLEDDEPADHLTYHLVLQLQAVLNKKAFTDDELALIELDPLSAALN